MKTYFAAENEMSGERFFAETLEGLVAQLDDNCRWNGFQIYRFEYDNTGDMSAAIAFLRTDHRKLTHLGTRNLLK